MHCSAVREKERARAAMTQSYGGAIAFRRQSNTEQALAKCQLTF